MLLPQNQSLQNKPQAPAALNDSVPPIAVASPSELTPDSNFWTWKKTVTMAMTRQLDFMALLPP